MRKATERNSLPPCQAANTPSPAFPFCPAECEDFEISAGAESAMSLGALDRERIGRAMQNRRIARAGPIDGNDLIALHTEESTQAWTNSRAYQIGSEEREFALSCVDQCIRM